MCYGYEFSCFNKLSVISWRRTEYIQENRRPATSWCQTVVYSALRQESKSLIREEQSTHSENHAGIELTTSVEIVTEIHHWHQ